MAILQIPLEATQDEAIVQEAALDGVVYRLELRWNDRVSGWFLTLRDLEDGVLAGSMQLVGGSWLTQSYVAGNMPPGQLLVIEDTGATPGRFDFANGRARLFYLDEEELASAAIGEAINRGGFDVHASMLIDTPAATTLATDFGIVLGTYKAGLLDGFAHTARRLVYTGSAARQFLAVVDGVPTVDTTGTYTFALFKDGVSLDADAEIEIGITTTDQPHVGLSFVVELETNNYLELWAKAAAGAPDLTMQRLVLSLIG